MSKIKLTGHASGSGVLTIAAPNTDSDRTITLPDVTGTLLDSGSDLPAANLTGSIAAARIASNTIDSAHITAGAIDDAHLATGISASKLTGALPAISGANLTGVGVAGISSSADATAITIDSSEKVGIGTTSPDEKLDVEGTIQISRTASYNATWKQFISHNNSSYHGSLYFDGSLSTGSILFRPNGVERFAIMADGRGLSQFTAKAWIHISNNATINDSHNISSLSDMTTGRMKIFFSNNPGGSNYSISAITSKNGGGASSSNFGRVCIPEDKYSSYFQLFTQLGTSNSDRVHTSAVIFGD